MEKADAMLQELQQQVLILSTRAAAFAGELSECGQRIVSLTAQVEKQAAELDDKRKERDG